MKCFLKVTLLGVVFCTNAHAGEADDLSPLDRIVGWRTVLDVPEFDAKSHAGWTGVGGEWSWPIAPGSELWWDSPLGDFDLLVVACDELARPEEPERRELRASFCDVLRVHMRASGLTLGANTHRWVDVPLAEGGEVASGPVAVKRSGVDARPWRLGLRGADGCVGIRRVAMREWDAPLGEVQSLFDGKSVKGWRPIAGVSLAVERGELVVDAQAGGEIVTERTFGDFRLEFDVMPEVADVQTWTLQLRAHALENGRCVGVPLCAGRADVLPARHGEAPEAVLARAWRRDGWKRVRVECVGPRVCAWVDGLEWFDTYAACEMRGALAFDFATHTTLRFANVAITDLGEQTWKRMPMKDEGKQLGAYVRTSVEKWSDFTVRISIPPRLADLAVGVRGAADAASVAGVVPAEEAKRGRSVLFRGAWGSVYDIPSRPLPPEAQEVWVSAYGLDGLATVDRAPESCKRGGALFAGANTRRSGIFQLVSTDGDALREVEVFVLESSTH